MKPVYQIPFIRHRLILATVLIATFFTNVLAQGGGQWAVSVNVGNGSTPPPNGWADWIQAVVTTQEGNYLGVGFALEDEQGGTHPDVPAYCLISPSGTLLRDGVVKDNPQTPTSGRLTDVVEANNDSYYAVGRWGTKGILLRINKSTLDAVAFAVLPSNPLYTSARITEVSVLPNSSGDRLICVGTASGNDLFGNPIPPSQWVAVFDMDGTLLHDKILDPQMGLNEGISAAAFSQTSGGNLEIFYAANIMKSLDGGFGQHRRHDSDIGIGRITYDPSAGTFTEEVRLFNSITQKPRNEVADAEPQGDDIFRLFPPSIADQYSYGPKYLNTNFARNFDNCNEPAPVNGFYIEDWSDGSEDVPYSIALTEDKIVVSALLNRLIMWEGTNDALGGDNDPGVHCNANPCAEFDGDYYLWGESYLLFFNKSDLTLHKAPTLERTPEAISNRK